MGVLIMVGRVLYDRFGTSGAIAGATTMGLFDVDAMTVSMTRLVPERLDPHAATYAILAGVASNTLSKVLIAALIGRGIVRSADRGCLSILHYCRLCDVVGNPDLASIVTGL